MFTFAEQTKSVVDCHSDPLQTEILSMEVWVGAALAVGTGTCAAVLLVFGLPGTWLLWLVATVFAWWTDFRWVGVETVGALLVLATLGEVLEFWLGASAARRVRPSWKVTAGALLGGFVGTLAGAPVLFGLGALVGSLLGTFLGAAAAAGLEGAHLREVLLIGREAMRGRWRGFLAKLAVVFAMSALFLFATVF